jgi:hypothetical protein
MTWQRSAPLILMMLMGCTAGGPQPAAVPAGDQEIAWIAPGTAGLEWERFVIGAQVACERLSRQGPTWGVDLSEAFRVGGDIPELIINGPGMGRIHVRWYKQTSDVSGGDWARLLAQRSPPPLAVIGGSTTDRARDLAESLASLIPSRPDPPLLLLTTATAVHIVPDPPQKKDNAAAPNASDQIPVDRLLTSIYLGRTFRFCFNNRQLAADALGYVEAHPDLRPMGQPPRVVTIEWDDDPYSHDFVNRTKEVLHAPDRPRYEVASYRLPYSVGGYYRPNVRESMLAERLLQMIPRQKEQRSLLIAPAVAGPCRRLLRALSGLEPMIGDHLVAVAGDAISFNTVYRDGGFAWSTRAVPVPLVLSAHENPVAWNEVPIERPSATDDVLLPAQIVQRILEAAFPARVLVTTPSQLAEGLRGVKHADGQPFFEASGDRAGRGTYVVCLRPARPGSADTNTLTVSRLVGDRWETVMILPLNPEPSDGP